MNNTVRKIRLEMPNPCTADLDQMPDVGNGRFCDRCNKTVHEVGDLSDGALQLFLNKKDKVCIQLHEDQLGRDILLKDNANESVKVPDISICILHDLMPGSILDIPVMDAIVHERRWLTGFLKDESSLLPLQNVIVSIDSLGIAFTNESGWFKLFVSPGIESNILALSVYLNTHEDNFREVLKQAVKVSADKIFIVQNTTIDYRSFTKTSSIKINEAYTLIQTSA